MMEQLNMTGNGTGMGLNSKPSLYKMCLRYVSKHLDLYNDLAHLPNSTKLDILVIHMQALKGFKNQEVFIGLLSSAVKRLIFNLTNVTDKMLRSIADQCTNLEELIFPCDPCDFTTKGLIDCFQCMDNLRVLRIMQTNQVDDNVLDAIGATCKQLRSLNLRNCRNVTSASSRSLKHLALTELDLSNTQIDDVFLLSIIGTILIESLKTLCLRGCEVTLAGMSHLPWHSLENLNIEGTKLGWGFPFIQNSTRISSFYYSVDL